MVPRAIQNRVYATYRDGQCDDMNVSLPWIDAAKAAIRAVAEAERVNQELIEWEMRSWDGFADAIRSEGDMVANNRMYLVCDPCLLNGVAVDDCTIYLFKRMGGGWYFGWNQEDTFRKIEAFIDDAPGPMHCFHAKNGEAFRIMYEDEYMRHRSVEAAQRV